MRGKGNVPGDKLGATRITPAYAGKSSTAPMIPTGGWDHPRVCGEKFRFLPARRCSQGSPPRMRGKVFVRIVRFFRSGITPAYAGKRLREGIKNKRKRDHPRVCGEKPVAMHTRITSAGSPPRMRGKESWPAASAAPRRITPAYAGKSIWLHRKSFV